MDGRSKMPDNAVNSETLDEQKKCPLNEESKHSTKCTTPAFDITAWQLCKMNKSCTSPTIMGQRLDKVEEETENQKQETTRQSEPDKSEPEINVSQCQEQKKCTTATENTCRMVFKRLIGRDSASNIKVGQSVQIPKTEKPVPLEEAFLKIEAKVCSDLHKFTKGTLFVTSERLTFLPDDGSIKNDQYFSLSIIEMPRNTLRSVAVYRDPSVFFFIKRPRLSKGGSMKVIEAGTSVTSNTSSSFASSNSAGLQFDSTAGSEDQSPGELTSNDGEYFLCCSFKNSQKVGLARQNQGNSTSAQWFLLSKSEAMKLHEFLRNYGPDLESVSPSEEAFNLSEKPDHVVLPTSSKELSGSPAGNSRPLSALVSSLENLIPKLNADTKRTSGPVSRRKYLGSLSHLIKTASIKEKRSKRPISLGSSEELFTAQVEVFEKEKIFDSTSSPCTPSFIEEKQAFDMLRKASLEWELISEEECTLRRENSNKPLGIESVGLQAPSSLLTSHILSEVQASKLFESLPLKAQGLQLALKYSTEYHGFSLKTLYRRCEALLTEDAAGLQEEDSESPLTLQNQILSSSCQSDQPCLLLIKDSTEAVLGAYMNCPPRMTQGEFYGTGECFVFHWTGADKLTRIPSQRAIPEEESLKSRKFYKRYLWSGENYFFLSGEQDSFIIGCTDGKSAIRIDGGVLRGRTQACGTFGNPELTEPGDFFIHTLEVWVFS